MPQPGDVYYSEASGRFYQYGRRGALSRDAAVRNLEYDAETKTFIDSRGRTITNDLLTASSRTAQRYTAQTAEGRIFISAEVKSVGITEAQAKVGQLNPNQDITVRTVVTTADGRTHVFYRSYGLGRNVDPEEAKQLAKSGATAALNKTKDAAGNFYKVTTPTVNNRTVRQDFYRRTIQATGRL